nr:hypothetical protein [Pseudarthrobacter sp. SSS035]
MLPLAAPNVFTTAILTFIHCWNETTASWPLGGSRSMPTFEVCRPNSTTSPRGQIVS